MNDIDEASSGPIISDQDRDIAHTALNEFQKGNYTACIQQLNRLDSRNQDFKLTHNRAVAEYFKTDLKKTDAFRKNLNAVFTQARMRPETIEDVEQCVAQYNLAVLLYHQHQNATALRIASRLLSFIEPMDESLAYRVCLLLLELHIVTQQPDKVLSLITYMENKLVNTETPTSSTGEKEIKILKKEPKDKKKIDSPKEIFQSKLAHCRVRCNLMMHSLKSVERNLKNLKGTTTSVQYLRANLEYLKGEYHSAIKIMQTIPPNELDFKQNGESSAILFYNNMGVLHHAMGKPHLACYYFQRAIKENDNTSTLFPKPDSNEPLSNRPLFTLRGSRKHELIFNLGVSLLHAGRSTDAFDCLVMAAQRYHRNPRLWLRLAECCIQAHKMSNKIDFDSKRQDKIMAGQIGKGNHKKIILTTNLSNDKKYSAESQSYAVPMPTLEFASLCLRNALLLLPSKSAPVVRPSTLLSPPGAPSTQPTESTLAPSSPPTGSEMDRLRCSILTASAYVSLCLGDYVMALQHATSLLKETCLSGAHKLLGHLYAAEAFVLMNKISSAIDHLNIENIKDISVLPSKEEIESEEKMSVKTAPPSSWFPNTLGTTHAVLRYNLAVALAIKGDYEKAAETLKQVWRSKSATTQIPIHVVMLLLYVELQLGHTEWSRTLIKQHCQMYR